MNATVPQSKPAGEYGQPHLGGRLLALAILIAAMLCGCSSQTATPAPVASPLALAATTAPPTSTPSPTATRVPPSPTPTFTPTSTSTATPTNTPTPTSTPTPVRLFAEADFSDRNPLTGQEVEDPAVLQRRPLAIKVSNSPAKWVRPQSGLGQADLVFEHVTEGPITRFTAIFYSQTPPDIGPIRSARLIDLELPAMYDAGLAFSGASTGVTQRLFKSDFFSRLILSYETGYYRTGADKPYEHTLYGDPQGFWQALESKGQNHAPHFTSYMAFSDDPPIGGSPATTVTINYREWTIVDWKYDPASNRYLRWADGEIHADANTGEQLRADNVIVLYAVHQLDESICEYQQDDKCLAGSVQITLWGQGDAIILRDGLRYDATWRRERRSDMLTFFNDAGEPLPLQIGTTWFQVVPYHYENAVAVSH